LIFPVGPVRWPAPAQAGPTYGGPFSRRDSLQYEPTFEVGILTAPTRDTPLLTLGEPDVDDQGVYCSPSFVAHEPSGPFTGALFSPIIDMEQYAQTVGYRGTVAVVPAMSLCTGKGLYQWSKYSENQKARMGLEGGLKGA